MNAYNLNEEEEKQLDALISNLELKKRTNRATIGS